ncbi:MAG: hypothetical protein JXB39_00170 [Deltaproteobacteria bacterium]|nr:hypothetical protein [Deltaproteobacteria bacterium]
MPSSRTLAADLDAALLALTLVWVAGSTIIVFEPIRSARRARIGSLHLPQRFHAENRGVLHGFGSARARIGIVSRSARCASRIASDRRRTP